MFQGKYAHGLIERRQEARTPIKVRVLRPCNRPLAPTGKDMVDGAWLSLDEVHVEMGRQFLCQYRFDPIRPMSSSKWPSDAPEVQEGWCWPALLAHPGPRRPVETDKALWENSHYSVP
jgi:hypothetical protein